MTKEQKEEAKTIAEEMQEKIAELSDLYASLEACGYSDHYIGQELQEGYAGGLRELIDELPKSIDDNDDDEEN